MNARAEWKGFDLSISTYGAAGFKAVDFVDVTLHSSYGALNKSVDLLNAWTPDNTNTDVPRVAYKPTGSITNDMFSQRFIQNASYLKIANIELGYNFPDKWFSGYVKGVRIYASGQNLATLIEIQRLQRRLRRRYIHSRLQLCFVSDTTNHNVRSTLLILKI